MPSLDSVKERGRGFLIHSMRACVANDRLPWIAKYLYVTGSQLLLPALGIESDETPLESEYGTQVLSRTGQLIAHLDCCALAASTNRCCPNSYFGTCSKATFASTSVPTSATSPFCSPNALRRLGKVIAIEAAPDTVRRLRANLEFNAAAGIVEVVEAACAPQKGEITFYLHPHNDGWCRLSPPAKGDPDRRLMGKTWIPVTVAADTLTSIVGADAERVSFIKVDIEGAETAITPQIAAGFSHPRLVVALEVRPPIEATLMPFQERGFYVYDLHNDYHWALRAQGASDHRGGIRRFLSPRRRRRTPQPPAARPLLD